MPLSDPLNRLIETALQPFMSPDTVGHETYGQLTVLQDKICCCNPTNADSMKDILETIYSCKGDGSLNQTLGEIKNSINDFLKEFPDTCEALNRMHSQADWAQVDRHSTGAQRKAAEGLQRALSNDTTCGRLEDREEKAAGQAARGGDGLGAAAFYGGAGSDPARAADAEGGDAKRNTQGDGMCAIS